MNTPLWAGNRSAPALSRLRLRALVGHRDRERQERDPGGLLGEPVPRYRADVGGLSLNLLGDALRDTLDPRLRV